MQSTATNSWLKRFAFFTAIATLGLIALGGLVTSKGVGMAVPDWPNTYGYNMFRFPISKWVGGILYEHTHRLMASFVGVLVVALTRWLGGRAACKPLLIIGILQIIAGNRLLHLDPELKGAAYFLSGIGSVVFLAGCVWVKNAPASRRLVLMGWTAFVLVQLQGLLGGLRVVLIGDGIGIFHAALAQLFFVLLCAIALFTTQWWQNLPNKEKRIPDRSGIQTVLLATSILIFAQLVLGATMRHQHAGLAIPDFPLAYHKIWPAMDPASIELYNQRRDDTPGYNPITAFQISLQLAHRGIALLIFIAVCLSAWKARVLGGNHSLAKATLLWLGLIALQIFLGAATIWSNKAADIATAHVVVGALSLMTGALLTIVSFRVLMPLRVAILTQPVEEFGSAETRIAKPS